MKKILFPAKYYILDSVITLLGLTISVTALFYLDASVHWLVLGFYGIFAILSVGSLFSLLWNIQWIRIDSHAICARNVFGTVKRMEFSKIKAIKVLNASAWRARMYSQYYPCILISSRKTVRNADVEDAYNHKNRYYVILPYTDDHMKLLREAYAAATGKEPDIG